MIVGIGVDVVEIDRVRRAMARTSGLTGRLFTPAEQADCADRPARFAGRFAAKEAVAKALGTGISGFGFTDVEIVRAGPDRPSVVLHGGARDAAARLGAVRFHLSLSDTATLATAYVIAEDG